MGEVGVWSPEKDLIQPQHRCLTTAGDDAGADRVELLYGEAVFTDYPVEGLDVLCPEFLKKAKVPRVYAHDGLAGEAAGVDEAEERAVSAYAHQNVRIAVVRCHHDALRFHDILEFFRCFGRSTVVVLVNKDLIEFHFIYSISWSSWSTRPLNTLSAESTGSGVLISTPATLRSSIG